MLGQRRRFENDGHIYYLVQKFGNALPKKLNINPNDVKKYLLIHTIDDVNFELIETFDTLKWDDIMLRAQIKAEHNLDIPKLTLKNIKKALTGENL